MGKGQERESGPSKNQLRGLTYNASKPKFLQNISTALSGAPSRQNENGGRPPIPTRPADDANGDDDDDGYEVGDEAPQVVVLKEGRHLSKTEAEEARKTAPEAANDASSSSKLAARKDASLRFASTTGTGSGSAGATGAVKQKRKIVTADEDENDDGSFESLMKRAKAGNGSTSIGNGTANDVDDGTPRAAESTAASAPTMATKKPLTKEEKAAMKARRKAAKKMLSFED